MRSLLCLFFALFLCSCLSTEERLDLTEEAPHWDGLLYVGDASRQAIVRKQAQTEIKCSDEKFSKMICMSSDDLTDLVEELHFIRRQAEKK